MSTMWVDLMGCQVRYYGSKYRTRVIEVGTGEPLILLHGLGGHAEAYSRNMVRLGQNFHAMAIDLLWHGLSSKPPFTNENIPRVLGTVLSALADRDVNVIDMVNKSLRDMAYNIIDVETEPTRGIIDAICSAEGVMHVRVI